jgi:hypothetical protein
LQLYTHRGWIDSWVTIDIRQAERVRNPKYVRAGNHNGPRVNTIEHEHGLKLLPVAKYTTSNLTQGTAHDHLPLLRVR